MHASFTPSECLHSLHSLDGSAFQMFYLSCDVSMNLVVSAN